MAKPDYYAILGVSKTASDEEIRSAYRKRARELHPDVNKAPDAAQRFSELQEAYDVLTDAKKRAMHDRGEPAYPGGPRGRQAHYTWQNVGSPSAGRVDFDVEDLGSIFETFFGQRGGFRTDDPFGETGTGSKQKRRKAEAARAADVETTIDVDFMVAAMGGSARIRFRDGDQMRTVDVPIPAGVGEGAVLRIPGAGPGGRNGRRGDLLVMVRLGKHPLFRRSPIPGASPLDIYLDLPLTISEATLGAKIRVPTLTGSAELTVPPGTPSGRTLRLRGCGIETETGTKGDLYAVTRIVPPDGRMLTESERAVLEGIGRTGASPRKGDGWPQ